MVAGRALGSLLAAALLAPTAAAQTVPPEPEPPPVRLDPVTVVAPPPTATSSEMVHPPPRPRAAAAGTPRGGAAADSRLHHQSARAGTNSTCARGASHRQGWEIATRVELVDRLTFTGDVTTTHAELDTGGAVPLAPRVTARADLTARLPFGLSTGLTMRYLGDRYADESRHQTARGYTLVDATTRYRWRWLEAFVSVENVFDVDWREAQLFFTSRLPGEPAGGVPDIHSTPGAPAACSAGWACASRVPRGR